MIAATRKILAGIVVGLVAAVLTLLEVVEPVELDGLNRLFELRGARPPRSPIVVVTIDEDSNDELGLPWPWPRRVHAQFLDALSAGHPAAIGLDVVFSTPSAHGEADDVALGDAVARAGNVVLAEAITVVRDAFYTKVDVSPPLPVIRDRAAAVGPVNLAYDRDGHVRRAPLRHTVGGDAVAGFDAALHRVAAAAGVPAAPLPAVPEIVINYRGAPGTFPRVPYYRVLRGEVPASLFKGKIVLIGATSPVLQDLFSTPFSRAREMPGVEIHANALETLLNGNRLHEVPAAASAVVALLAAVAGAALVARLRALRALLGVGAVGVLVGGSTFGAFALGDVWFRSIVVLLALFVGYGATVVDNFIREQREKRRLSQFFSPAVLREVVRQRSDVSLGSSRRLVTVLFSDIRGFTSISERLEPEEVAEMLREYLTEMTEVVFRHRGTVDKYIGDCVMALYNVPFEDPDHALNAVLTGLEFQERTLAVSARWEAKLGVRIRNGVGINTGEAVVGTLGSLQRLEYTAIGDTVNLASRLEGTTKEFGVPIIVSESTYAAIKGRFLTRELGAVPVKGKAQPVKIYGVLSADVRKYPRTAMDAAATVTATGEGGSFTVRVHDVSEGGMAVEGLPAEWAVGRKLTIRCAGGWLPDAMTIDGAIMWRREDVAGIAFTAPVARPGPVC